MNKLKAVIGITNKTEDNKYIPFLDFDEITYNELNLQLSNVQQKYNLTVGFIIKSNNGYNVFFLDKLNFGKCLSICRNCHGVDKNYIEYAIKKHNFTLRLGDDKKFICMFPNVLITDNELSIVHYLFYCEFFHENILNGVSLNSFRFDNLERIQLVRYMSKKYGYIEVD